MHCVLYNSEKTNSPLRLLILCFIHLAPASITHRLIWVEHKIKYVIITFLRWKHLYNMLETFSGDKRRDSLKTNQVYTITHGSLIKLSQMFLNNIFYCLIVVKFKKQQIISLLRIFKRWRKWKLHPCIIVCKTKFTRNDIHVPQHVFSEPCTFKSSLSVLF